MNVFQLRKPKLFAYNELLPNQKVPKLTETIDQYIASCIPTKTTSELDTLRTKSINFLKTIGPTLQLNLEHNSWTEDNYVSEWWTKNSYLMFRDSLLKLNFFGGGLLKPPSTIMTSRAAMLIDGYLDICQKISSGKLEAPLLQRMVPLCTEQYKRFHSTSRIPGESVDYLKTWSASEHIAVNYRHRWYIIDINQNDCVLGTGEKKHRVNAKEWELIFEKIVQNTNHDQPSKFELLLTKVTGGKRNEWSSIRSAISHGSTVNSKALELIESAVLHITLEDEIDISVDDCETDIDPTKLSMALCTGNGKRWFDKSVSLIAFKNGAFGAGYDHSWGDGAVTMNVYEKVLNYEQKIGYDHDGRILGEARLNLDPTRLLWEEDKDIVASMEIPSNYYDSIVNDIDMSVFNVPFGKEVLKKLKVSPDAFIQSCLQLAHYRYTNKFVLTYEAAVTLLFKSGRYYSPCIIHLVAYLITDRSFRYKMVFGTCKLSHTVRQSLKSQELENSFII